MRDANVEVEKKTEKGKREIVRRFRRILAGNTEKGRSFEGNTRKYEKKGLKFSCEKNERNVGLRKEGMNRQRREHLMEQTQPRRFNNLFTSEGSNPIGASNIPDDVESFPPLPPTLPLLSLSPSFDSLVSLLSLSVRSVVRSIRKSVQKRREGRKWKRRRKNGERKTMNTKKEKEISRSF